MPTRQIAALCPMHELNPPKMIEANSDQFVGIALYRFAVSSKKSSKTLYFYLFRVSYVSCESLHGLPASVQGSTLRS